MSLQNYLRIINCCSLIFSIALIGSFPANAANWVEVGVSDGVIVSVDTESLHYTGSKVKSWLQWQWSEPTDVPNTYPVKLYQMERQLQVSDCKAKTLAVVQGVRYVDISGNEVVDSYTIEEKFWQFSEAVPETIGESIIKYVCKAAAAKRK